MLIDSHAHLDLDDYRGDLDAVIARSREAGLARVVCVGLWRGPGDFGNALALADRDPGFFAATIGIHPHEAARVPEEDWGRHEALARDPRVAAVGETGLDFHYDHSPRDVQEAAFRRSLRTARAAGKPVVIHVREADAACLRVLREEGVPEAGGVIHCFTGDAPAARAYLDLGLYVSVAGIVTFKTAEPIREAVRIVPRDRLLVETDSPFLAPIPFRGKRNEPAHVVETARRVAELWGAPLEEVAARTAENTRRLFRLA
ncbi:TatD family hydrolase [Anaeromyxobacter sp. PSR-1]|uniref:TatD family hydrolase n=1 Tax=Anaeromyxobacter sp. PSR-1 TaxID=1300915 RepID=UPI0005E3F9D3|nr:TatD family hydrolase [Anaeromyxobacter sp. PSR-1]GAO03427.1 putative deoxyribonuclease YabD [Anaeromyxobacter sp. PSR-1]